MYWFQNYDKQQNVAAATKKYSVIQNMFALGSVIPISVKIKQRICF